MIVSGGHVKKGSDWNVVDGDPSLSLFTLSSDPVRGSSTAMSKAQLHGSRDVSHEEAVSKDREPRVVSKGSRYLSILPARIIIYPPIRR